MLSSILPTDIHFVNVCGLGNAGPELWMTKWEEQFPDQFSRVKQENWDEPEVSTWVMALHYHISSLNHQQIILVGHSMGCATIAHYVHSNLKDERVLGGFLVGPADVTGPELPESCHSFQYFPKRLSNTPLLTLISENDPYISLKKAINYCDSWGSEYLDLGKQGHFCSEEKFQFWKEGLEFLSTYSNRLVPLST